jgi:predicted amidophosphoribosyltransferase
MTPQDPLAQLRDSLVARAGGYLRNPVRLTKVTCAVCARPSGGFQRCHQCRMHRYFDGLADATAIMTYAVAGQQSGYVMRGYKVTPEPVGEHWLVVRLLAALGVAGHARCAGDLAGAPVSHWAAVPSLPARPGEHPLHQIVSPFAPGREAGLAAAPLTQYPRDVTPDHFTVTGQLPPDAHVLLLDDTWVSGGHAQSAAMALHKAGAARVSLLVIARWMTRDTRIGTEFLRELEARDYDPAICPWTGTTCPR